MVSDAKKKKAAAKKAKAVPAKAAEAAGITKVEDGEPPAEAPDTNGHANGHAVEEEGAERACTGILTSHPQSRDIHFESFTLLFHGHELLVDTNLELNFGRCIELLTSPGPFPV